MAGSEKLCLILFYCLFLGNKDPTTVIFMVLYLLAALIQVGFLLKLSSRLVNWLWLRNIDPDNAAIPYLTSLGDLLGGALLALAVYIESLLLKKKV
jgi:solute carrier family 41